MNKLQKVLDNLYKTYELNATAPVTDINAAEAFFNVKFPADYRQFLEFTNGLEGLNEDLYLVLWSAEELVSLNTAYNVAGFIDDILIIGSDGAEEAFAFYIKDMSIVQLPFIGMGHVATEKLADSFYDFLSVRTPMSNNFFKRFFS